MRITSVSYSRLVSLENYENEKVGGTAAVEEDADPMVVIAELKDWVQANFTDKRRGRDIDRNISDLEYKQKQVEEKLERSVKIWKQASAFLQAHGLVAPESPWWMNIDRSEGNEEDGDEELSI